MAEQLDMFARDGEQPSPSIKPAPRAKVHSPNLMSDADMVAHLTDTGRYRILEKVERRPIATLLRDGYPLRGVIVDTETTGLDHRKSEILKSVPSPSPSTSSA